MNQIDKPDDSLPEWLVKQAPAIGKLRQMESGLYELLEDHARLTEAIHYWTGRSAERVEEFDCIAREIEREIMEVVKSLPTEI
jgi:hypothetical protein